MSGVHNSSVDTVNAAAAAIASTESRILQVTAAQVGLIDSPLFILDFVSIMHGQLKQISKKVVSLFQSDLSCLFWCQF